MTCPGSVRLSRTVPDAGTSVYAEEGTAAHEVAQVSLNRGLPPQSFIGMQANSYTVTEDMADYVAAFTNFCEGLRLPGGKVWIERQFNLLPLNPPVPMFGTADFVAITPDRKVLDVVDLKYGVGVLVEANGPQLKYYALGALISLGEEGFGVETVRLTIVQPRAGHPDGIIRTHTMTTQELIDFAAELLDAARRTQEPDAPLKAGEHCRFCPVSGVCPERLRYVQELAQDRFAIVGTEPVLPPKPETLSLETIAEFMPKFAIIRQWMGDVEEKAREALDRGEEVPGYKLVAKRPSRHWTDKAQAEALLASAGIKPEDIYEKPELRSPAQIEKVVKKKEFKSLGLESLTIKVSSGANMVPSSDTRPAIASTAQDAFLLTSGEE